MDHLPEEQRRAITMKSSSVALRHANATGVHLVDSPGVHLTHLIDSPGHADFCSEVSPATRLSDSAHIQDGEEGSVSAEGGPVAQAGSPCSCSRYSRCCGK
jgi:translation elongation factor EF-G